MRARNRVRLHSCPCRGRTIAGEDVRGLGSSRFRWHDDRPCMFSVSVSPMGLRPVSCDRHLTILPRESRLANLLRACGLRVTHEILADSAHHAHPTRRDLDSGMNHTFTDEELDRLARALGFELLDKPASHRRPQGLFRQSSVHCCRLSRTVATNETTNDAGQGATQPPPRKHD